MNKPVESARNPAPPDMAGLKAAAMKRLFFALWPDETTRRDCEKVAKAVSRGGQKRVRPENLHVTLVFLGSIDTDAELAISRAAAAIAVDTMTIAFDRLDFWSRPRIICLTGQNSDPGLAALVTQLTADAAELGIPVDTRPFKPHVTLVRKAKDPAEIKFEPIIWRANSFCLVESCSMPGGVEYRVIRQWGQPRSPESEGAPANSA